MYSRRFVNSLGFVVALVLSGCSDALGPGNNRSQLDANRQKWQARGFRDYSVTMRILCFCPETSPLNVTVLGDSVMSATRVSDGKPVDARQVPTINKLFDFIDRAITERAVTIDVTYDPELGYPRQIVYDKSLDFVDEEITYTVTNMSSQAQRGI